RGLFAGVSLDGGVITIDQEANAAWYGSGNSAASSIFSDRNIPTPPGAAPLLATLGKMAPKLSWKNPGQQSAPATSAPPPAGSEPDAASRTYPIDDGAAGGAETKF
ncbi:MAG: YSC84-related protein, partial [Gammaproteobacteria bacterium]